MTRPTPARKSDGTREDRAIETVLDDLAALMADRGVTRSDLARRLGIGRARVSDIFRRGKTLNLRSLVRLAEALDCELSVAFFPAAKKRGER